MTITVTVTRAKIAAGIAGDDYCCCVALAMADALGCRVSVGGQSAVIEFPSGDVEVCLPPELKYGADGGACLIGRDAKPFAFELT